MATSFEECPRCHTKAMNIQEDGALMMIGLIRSLLTGKPPAVIDFTGLLNMAALFGKILGGGFKQYLVFENAEFIVRWKVLFFTVRHRVRADLFYCANCGYSALQGIEVLDA